MIKNKQAGKVTLDGPRIENVYAIYIDNLPLKIFHALKSHIMRTIGYAIEG